MNGKTRSILLQVAFKEASGDRDSTLAGYKTLIALHDELGIEPDEGSSPRRSGGGGGSVASAPKVQVDAPTFMNEGELWTDYRAAKASGAVKPLFPDFKNVSTNTGVWLLDKQGLPTEQGAKLVSAADTAVF